jgi:hypothetical protein
MDSAGVWKFEIITAFRMTQIGRIKFFGSTSQMLKWVWSSHWIWVAQRSTERQTDRETEKIEEQRLDVIYQH